MNPLLPVLLAVSLAGLLVARRRAGLVWCAAGLAAIALLAPALRLGDGIPSPAADLARHAPWHGLADPADGNATLQDVTYQVQPWLLFLRHELRHGRLPLWNPFQSSGTPNWSNGSSAPLFPLHLLFALLPAQAGWLVLPWLRVVLGAIGVWGLGRELGLSRSAALLAGLVFPLAGMPVGFLLFPMGNALALAPWVLWAVERLANGRGGWVGLGVAGGLQLLGGHPETAVHTALVSGLYLLVRGGASGPDGGPVRTWGRWTAGWLSAGALASVHLLPLAATLVASSRWQAHQPGEPPPAAVLLTLPLRLVLPDLFGNPADGTWWGPYYWVSTAVYAGAAVLPLAAAGLAAVRRTSSSPALSSTPAPESPAAATSPAEVAPTSLDQAVAGADAGGPTHFVSAEGPTHFARGGAVAEGPTHFAEVGLGRGPTHFAEAGPRTARGVVGGGGDVHSGGFDRRWLAVVAVLAFSLAAAYQAPGVRHLLGALPVLERALHHRLLFAVDLALALLAGAGLDRWRAGGARWTWAGSAAVLAMLGAAWWRFAGDWAERGLLPLQAGWTIWVGGVAVALAIGVMTGGRGRRLAALALPALVAIDLVVAHASFNPGLPVGDLYPRTAAVRFLAGRPGRVAATGQALRPNAAMVYRLHDVRGDDSVKSAAYEALMEDVFGAGHATYFVPLARVDARWLDRLGVRWWLTGPDEAAPEARVALVYAGTDARIWSRPGALPPVRWLDAAPGCSTRVAGRLPGRWVIDWRCSRRARLLIAESWDAGWRARTGGREVPVEPALRALLGVPLGPGSGRLELTYRPVGLVPGAAISSAAAVLLLAGARLRRRAGHGHPPGAATSPVRLPASRP